jgi:antitoxin VapB
MESSMERLTTTVFNSDDGQAVRIPAEFRLDADHVSISRSKSGDLVIHALQASRGAALLEALRAVGEADVDLVAALGAEQAGQRLLRGCEAL